MQEKKESIFRRIGKTKGLQFINQQIIDPITRWKGITIAYMVFASCMLLHHVYVTIYYEYYPNGSIVFHIWWDVFAVISIFLGRLWKDKCFWILAALLVLKYVRVAAIGPNEVILTFEAYRLAVYFFFGCYAIGRVLSEKDRNRFIALFSALWTTCVLVLFAIGLYTVWTGTEVKNLGGGSIRFFQMRLSPVYHPVEGGVIASITIAMALVALNMTKNRTVKILYIISIVFLVIVGALCVTRMSYIFNALAVSLVICFYVFSRRKMLSERGTIIQKFLPWAGLMIAFVGLVVFLTYIQTLIVPGYNAIHGQKSLFISNALAESGNVADTSLVGRKIVLDKGLDGFLNGRVRIWQAVMEAAKEDPSIWLTGHSIYHATEQVIAIGLRTGMWDASMIHVHNSFLQTFLENGIPGFLLLLSFFVIYLKNAISLIRNKNIPFWKRIIFLPAAICWIAEMVDCTAYSNFGKPPATILYLFSGLTIAIAFSLRKNRKMEKLV